MRSIAFKENHSPRHMPAADLLRELGLRADMQLPITTRLAAPQLARLDQVAGEAGVSRARMAQGLLQDALNRYCPAN